MLENPHIGQHVIINQPKGDGAFPSPYNGVSGHIVTMFGDKNMSVLVRFEFPLKLKYATLTERWFSRYDLQSYLLPFYRRENLYQEILA